MLANNGTDVMWDFTQLIEDGVRGESGAEAAAEMFASLLPGSADLEKAAWLRAYANQYFPDTPNETVERAIASVEMLAAKQAEMLPQIDAWIAAH